MKDAEASGSGVFRVIRRAQAQCVGMVKWLVSSRMPLGQR